MNYRFFGVVFGTLVAAVAPLGCSSPTTQTSSSSHWVVCRTDADCSGTASCSAGYCSDASGTPVEEQSSNADPYGACDPLASPEVTLTLGADILGAGKDADGNYYVADVVDGKQRLFVSAGDAITRVSVIGSGSSDTPGDSFDAIVFRDDGGQVKTFVVRHDTGGDTLALVPGGDYKSGALPDFALLLEPVDDATLRSFSIVGWTNPIDVEYLAQTESKKVIMVTRPDVDWQYTDFRLFYGDVSRLDERAVSNVSRARDGGSTHIEFDLDGAAADVFFPYEGDPTLSIGSSTEPVSIVSSADVVPQSYRCLRH